MGIISKLLIAAGLLGGAFYAGYVSHSPETIVKWKTKTEIKEVAKVITARTTQRVIKPDGTKTETVTEQITKNTETKTKDHSFHSQIVSKPAWSLELRGMPQLTTPYFRPSSIEVGYRVFGDLWSTGSYDWHNQEVLIGIRWEF